MSVTKREVLFSIVIICVMLIIGIVIAGNINDTIMEKQQEYITALQIDNDKDLFEYGMRTNVGNAFIYGDLKAVDTVTFDEIGGEYSYVEKVKEKYTRHTRTVTKTKTVNGKTQTYTDTEVYWTWDKVDSWDKHCEKITFLNVEFDYGKIHFPTYDYITTIKESSRIRYVYYGTGTNYTGTLYTSLSNNTINGASFYVNNNIAETLEYLESGWELITFWLCWIFLTGGVVYGFYYLDNRWLENNNRRKYY